MLNAFSMFPTKDGRFQGSVTWGFNCQDFYFSFEVT